jgi:transcriptional regulator GlxA family with amidase domain
MLPALRTPEQISRLFAEHVALALAAHVAHAYGGMQTAPRLVKGGLAPWQELRAKEMLTADLSGSTSLDEIAAACRLSPDYFARAFRRSTSLPPHRWLLQARVERAMALLKRHRESLGEIALACGFVDQSHLTRVFTARVGVSPGAWRRMVAK